MKDGNSRRTLALRLVLLAMAAAGFMAWTREMQRTQSFGRYTRQQALERVRPLLAALAPRDACLLLSVEPYKTYLRDGQLHPQWCIDVSDDSGNHLAYIRFDADTGDLCEVAPMSPLALFDRPMPDVIDAAEAIERSEKWLVLLGMASESHPWQVDGTPEHAGKRLWMLPWRIANRSAHVFLNGRGELIAVIVT